MAITAKFLADFESFDSAVKKAEAELRSLESGASKVQASLNRMADSFSGRKIIQDANLAASAIQQIGGASKLTESEQKRVNATVTEAIAKYAALGKEAPAALYAIQAQTSKVVSTVEQLPKVLSSSSKAAGILQSAFAQFTLAGLATNAISSMASSLGEFANIGFSKLPAVEASFGRLTKSMKQDSTEMLSIMTSATKGMVSNYDLMLSANKAMLLGLPVTSESMGELAKTAAVLGKAMGQDATTSLNDLITALGRSSPMILDNLGLTVKVGEANEAYAAKLGKSAEALSDSEKKMAFYEAAMEAARKKTKELGDQTLTLSEIALSVWTRIGNEVSSEASRINNAFGPSEQQYALSFFSTLGLDAKKFSTDLSDLGRLVDTVRGKMDKLPSVAAEPKDLPAQQKPLGMSVEEMQAIGNALDKEREALNRAAEAAKKWRETLDAAFRKWSGADMVEQAKILDITFRRMADSGQITAQQLNDMAKEAAKLASSGATLSPRLWAIVQATGALDPKVETTAEAFENLGYKIKLTIPPLDDFIAASNQLQSTLKYGADAFLNIGTKIDSGFGQGIRDAALAARNAQRAIQELAGAFQTFAQLVGGSIGNVASAIGQGIQAAGQFKSVLNDPDLTGSQKFIAGASAVMQMVKALQQATAEGTTAQRALSGAATGASIGTSIMPGYGTLIGAGVGAAYGGIRGALSSAGRQAVLAFAEAAGGFEKLHADLIAKLGATSGEMYWKKLTQEVGEGDQRMAQKVIAQIQAAFAATPEGMSIAAGYQTRAELQSIADKAQQVYEYMKSSGLYTAESIADAFKRMKDAQLAAMDDTARAAADAATKAREAAQKQIDSLNGQIKSLQDSIANEAPEEVMGVVEAQARAQIEALTKERNAAQQAIDETAKQAAEAADEAGGIIDDALEKREFKIKVKVDLDTSGIDFRFPNGTTPRLPRYAEGGYVSGSRLAVVGDSQEYITPRRSLGMLAKELVAAGGLGGGDGYMPVKLVMPDGSVLVEQVVKVARREGWV